MQYYLLRMMNHANGFGRKLFENNYISIGYRDFDKNNNFNFIELYNNKADKEKLLKDNIKHWGIDKIGSHWKLDKFFKFKVGDIVLIPDSRCFYLVKVKSEIISFETIKNQFCSEEENPDIGFVYEIEKLYDEGISRADFAEAKLTARMKCISGLLNITDLEDEIKKAQNAFETNKPININEGIKESVKKIMLEEIRKKLEPNKFEEFLRNLMYRLGANTVDIPPRNDKSKTEEGHGDIDIIAIFEKLKHIIYIQAKFHEGETDSHIISQINDYNDLEKLEEGYTQSFWAVTTADSFSEECKKLIDDYKEKNIRLINGEELCEMILDVGIETL